MKRIKIIAIGLILCCTVTGFKVSNDNTNKTVENEKNILLDVEMQADFEKDCNSIQELSENSDCIISGNVISKNSWCDDTCTIYTDYTVKINEVYQGNLNEGDEITITDFGGTVSADEYFKYQTDPKVMNYKKEAETNGKDNYIKYSFEGAWLPDEGKQYIWYLEDNSYDNKKCYNPVNCYEGIYKVNNSNVERYEPSDNSEPDRITSMEKTLMENEIKSE